MELGDAVGGALELGLAELLRLRLVQTIPVANPAVGADWSAKVPPGCAWEVLGVKATLTTDAVVANRAPALVLSDPNRVVHVVPSGIAQAASLADVYEWAIQYASPTVGSPTVGILLPLPAIPLSEGSTIASLTAAIDPGDQWSNVVLVVRQWSLTDVEAAAGWLSRRSSTVV